MRALVKTKAASGLELLDVPKPSAGPGHVVVKVLATSLCGTDNHIYRWDKWAQGRIHPPRIIGRELCGEVVEAGPGVAAVAVGDYVAAESHITCAVCFQCRTGNAHVCKNYRILGIDEDGSYAEYVRLPERVLWKTSREIPPEFACLQEPLGNAVHAALVEDLTGQSVLITGCGPTGLFAVAVARTAGAGVIIASDVSDYRLSLAKQLGADHTINPTRDDADLITRVTGGEGVDVALEMSGNPTAIHKCFLYVKNGGRVTLFGIPEAQVSFDMTNEIIFKGIRVYGVTGRRLFQTWYRLSGLFKAGLNIKPVVTHVLPLDRFAEGFDLVAKGQCGKVVLRP
ncbi:MAG: L-threonine 3-dehydrogenase [Nitrospirae bacterium]|nr:MAG: L-threonine 3-dehydrogenase [Nitrospirota bacterium]